MNSNDTNRLDRWLDEALRQCASAEPRVVGLEGRILASLASRAKSVSAGQPRTVIPTFGWARLSLAFAGLGVLGIVAVAIWVGTLRDHGRATTSTSPRPVPGALNQNRDGMLATVPLAHHTSRRVAVHRAPRKSESATIEAVGASPRLEHFPSQRPLSEQEQLLKAYVSQFPKVAAVVAVEQAEREKELESLYSDATGESDSAQER